MFLVALVAIVCFTFIACTGKDGQTRSVIARGHVPVICQEQGGKFFYYTPIRDYVKVYPLSLMDSVRALPKTPAMTVSYRTISKDSFEVSVLAPVECLLKDMDELKFVYPPEAKYSVRKDIYWTDKQFVPLAQVFWIVGVKNGIKHVYTPEGKMLLLSEANEVLHTAVDQPQAEPKATPKDTVSLAPPITSFRALEKPSEK